MNERTTNKKSLSKNNFIIYIPSYEYVIRDLSNEIQAMARHEIHNPTHTVHIRTAMVMVSVCVHKVSCMGESMNNTPTAAWVPGPLNPYS